MTGGANPVAGPYFNHSAPEPTGVVAGVAPKGPAARPGLGGRAADHHRQHLRRGGLEEHPLTAITLAEVMATADVPGGVVNILTGQRAETRRWLASHMDVNGLDLTGVDDHADSRPSSRLRGREPQARPPCPGDEDWLATPGWTG